jgi:hypothetical protein
VGYNTGRQVRLTLRLLTQKAAKAYGVGSNRLGERVERHGHETYARPRVTEAIIDEHRERPIGKHSDELERVLAYLHRRELETAGGYILVCTRPDEEWRIATLGDDLSVPPRHLSGSFPDLYEAEHALLLKRLADAGLLPE